MKLWQFILVAVSVCLPHAVSQNSNRRTQQKSTINREQIYFDDKRPGATLEVQKSVEPQNYPADSYSLAAFNVKEGFDQRVQGQQPSSDIQPPNLDNSGHNYYSAYSKSKGALNASIDEDIPQVTAIPHFLRPSNLSFAVCNFGLNILKNVNQLDRNLVVSPFSVAQLLALLQQGAQGETQQQITNALQLTPQMSATAFRTFNENIQKRSSHNILEIANNLYIANAFSLNPMFKMVAMRFFGSEVTPIEFSEAQNAVTKINNWVARKTKNKITELLTSDAVSENTQILMVNAVYFKGQWAIKFQAQSTLPRGFHVTELAKKTIPFMRIRKIFRAGVDSSNDARVIILPFENDQYSLMVIVPSPVSSLEALVSTLTPDQVASYFTYSPKEVDLELPKFTVKADTDLNPVFRKIGITNVFSQKSELSGIGTYRTFSPQLSSALHTAMLTIDEEGGAAAAATSFAAVALSYDDPSLVIKANRPFLTILWENDSIQPLFMAKIHDPSI